MEFAAVLFACLLGLGGQESDSSDSTRPSEELVQWFSQEADKRGPVPESFRERAITSAEELEQARAQVWMAYEAGAKAKGWDQQLPETAETDIRKARRNAKSAKAGDKEMPFVLLSKGEKPENGWPLFINLHGGGGNPSATGPHDWGVNTSEWRSQMKLYRDVYEPSGLYFIPRMVDDREGRWYYGYNQEIFDRVIQQAILYHDVDPNRVYLTGISEGGYGAFRLGSLMADRWAGSCAMAAAEPLNTSPPENMRNIAFRCGIGELDTTFDRIGLARNYFKVLTELKAEDPDGFNFLFDEQQGRGHGINYKPGPSWVANHTRTPVPRRVVWTVIKQHDRHRHRMYWLALNGEAGSLPLHLTAEAKENHIEITAQRPSKEDKDLRVNEDTIQLRVYLNNELVDLSQPVTINVNGQERFRGHVEMTMEAMILSTAERGDPTQVYPAQVTIQ